MSRSRRNKPRKCLHSARPRKGHDDYHCDLCLENALHKHIRQAQLHDDESGSREQMASARRVSPFAAPGGTGNMGYGLHTYRDIQAGWRTRRTR